MYLLIDRDNDTVVVHTEPKDGRYRRAQGLRRLSSPPRCQRRVRPWSA
ncbi:hypothetical protein ACIPX0_19305 [Streptomyces sp. NPDC090075]